MFNKIIAGIISGIIGTITIVMLLIAWAAISYGLSNVSPNNPNAEKVINESDKAVKESVSWYFIIDDIEGLITFVGIILAVIFGAIWLFDKIEESNNTYYY
jgi:hypothetical protein